jgi:hypothetical protein
MDGGILWIFLTNIIYIYVYDIYAYIYNMWICPKMYIGYLKIGSWQTMMIKHEVFLFLSNPAVGSHGDAPTCNATWERLVAISLPISLPIMFISIFLTTTRQSSLIFMSVAIPNAPWCWNI